MVNKRSTSFRLIGVIILSSYIICETRINSIIESESFYIALILFGVGSLIGTVYFSSELILDNFSAVGGLMIGAGIGFFLKERYLKFETIRGQPF
jgi:membrane associated rhomboid family serine protease